MCSFSTEIRTREIVSFRSVVKMGFNVEKSDEPLFLKTNVKDGAKSKHGQR